MFADEMNAVGRELTQKVMIYLPVLTYHPKFAGFCHYLRLLKRRIERDMMVSFLMFFYNHTFPLLFFLIYNFLYFLLFFGDSKFYLYFLKRLWIVAFSSYHTVRSGTKCECSIKVCAQQLMKSARNISTNGNKPSIENQQNFSTFH